MPCWAFELVTEMCTPLLSTKDPSTDRFSLLLCFLGMMVADISYGLLLTVATGCPKASSSILVQPEPSRFFSLLGVQLSFGVWSMALSLDLRCLLP